MDIDRQAIERRDFPIARRGYDTAAVDTHLRALAAEFEELQRASAGGGGEPSLAATAATQVESILSAAETAAADIERQALGSATAAREEADRDAERTREDALSRARAHVAAVAQATAVLLERVSSMDAEVSALVESVRGGADRLARDLTAVETSMGELYDAAAGPSASSSAREEPSLPLPSPAPASPVPPPAASPPAASPPAAPASAASPPAAPAPPLPRGKPPTPAPAQSVPPAPSDAGALTPAGAPTHAGANGDLDGARLVALNMALNGESRADADRYLAENFQLADREKLIDEVFAAIKG